MEDISLITDDGKEYKVKIDILKHSIIIKNMLNDTRKDTSSILIPNIPSDILSDVLRLLKLYNDDPREIIEEDFKKHDILNKWENEFLGATYVYNNIYKYELTNEKKRWLFSMIEAANYLDIEHLFIITCKYIANFMKGMSIEDIKREFNIKDGVTSKQEKDLLMLRDEGWI